MVRPERRPWMMTMAYLVAIRGSCPRRQVGSVLVKNGRPVSAGYVGSIPHSPHCDEVGCEIVNGRCLRTIHAEVNCLSQAGRLGIVTTGTLLYTTDFPCLACQKQILASGIAIVYYHREYQDVFSRVKVEKILDYQIQFIKIDPMSIEELTLQFKKAYQTPQT